MQSKRDLRKILRTRRRTLTPQAQRLAARNLTRQLQRLPLFIRARHIAGHWPADGEISPLPFLRELQRQGKTVYLPEVLTNGQLGFRRFHIAAHLGQNRYGIPEPLSREHRFPQDLDIVLMPLVGFDRQGNRLGMGGGYYDRTFAFLRQQAWHRRPVLVGLAHDFQQVASLSHDDWDIPLQVIVTDTSVIRP